MNKTIHKIISTLLILAMVACMIPTALANGAETEAPDALLKNGGFLQNMTVMTDGNLPSQGNWTSMSWASTAYEKENAHTGNSMCNMVYAADGLPSGEFPTIYQDVAVAKNSIYRLTFYAKNWNFGATVQPLYYGYRNALQDVWTPVEQYVLTDLDGTYRQITMEFNTKELTHIRVFAFTTSVTGGIGGYHLDDFKLEYVQPAEVPETEDPNALLKNGGFLQNMVAMTDGNLPSQGNWTSMSWASTAYEKENAHTGKSMANMVYAADGLPAGEYPTIYQDVAVAKNSIYRLSFYAKNWNFGAEAQPLYFGYRNALQDVWTPVEQVTVTNLGNEYTELTLEFNTKDLTNIRIFAFTTSVTGGVGGYHLDDFKLEYVRAVEIPETDDPDALLKNGGFIQDMIAMIDGNLPSQGNWTSMSWASTAYEKENAHTGKSMANMVYAADGLPAGEFPTIYQDVAVEQNSVYRLTFYAKHWNFGAEAQPLYFGYRNALQDVWTPVEQVTVTDLGNEYTQLTLEFDTKELTDIRIFAFTTSVLGGIGGYHLDDFKLEYVRAAEIPETEDPDALLKNGGFLQNMVVMTDGNLPSQGNWTSMSWASTAYEKENAHTGNSMCNMVISAPGLPAGEFPTIYQDVAVKAQSAYTITFYAKYWSVDGKKAPLYYGFRNGTKDVWVPVEEFMTTSIGNDYEKVTFTIHTGNVNVARIFVFTTSLTSDGISGYHLDDFQMTYVGPYYTGPSVAVSKDVDADNLVYDSGFEKGDSQPVPSDPREFADTWTMMSVAGVDAGGQFGHTGKSNLFMAYAAEGMLKNDYPTVWQDVQVAKNTWYEMSFYVKQWGVDAADDQLYFGYRDPNAGDIWTNVEEFTKSDFKESYQRVTCRFYTGDRDVIRLFFCIVARDFKTVGGAGGYHIDNVRLQKLSTPVGATLTIQGKPTAGAAISYKAVVDLANGTKKFAVIHSEDTAICFESEDESIVSCDFSGHLIAVASGTTRVRMGVTRNGVTAWSDWKQITVQQNASTHLMKVEPQLEGELTTGVYVPLTYRIIDSLGADVAAGGCKVTVESDNPDVAWAKKRNDGYVIYGTGCGTATICVTAEKDGFIAVGKLTVTVADKNVLKDSSFEMQAQAAPYWKIIGSAAYGVDDSSTNQLSRTGDANIWAAAPISWSDVVLPGSNLELSQYVELEPGQYTMSGFINRFYATGTEGILAELGGLVQLGIEDSQGNIQQAEFNVTYGVGRYQQLDAYLNVENAGTYLVFVRIQGDELSGLGLQVDDVTLQPTQFPEQIVATDVTMEAGKVTQLNVVARYNDGTEVEVQNYTLSIAEETVAKVSGRNVVGVAAGSVTVTVEAQIAGQTYTAQCQITVTGEAVQAPGSIAPAEQSNWYIYAIAGITVLAIVAAAVIVIKKKKV